MILICLTLERFFYTLLMSLITYLLYFDNHRISCILEYHIDLWNKHSVLNIYYSLPHPYSILHISGVQNILI